MQIEETNRKKSLWIFDLFVLISYLYMFQYITIADNKPFVVGRAEFFFLDFVNNLV